MRFVSDGGSLASTGFSSGSTFGVAVDCDDGDDFVSSVFGGDEKRARCRGESFSVAILDCFFILSDRPLGAGVALVEFGVDMVLMVTMDRWMVCVMVACYCVLQPYVAS